MLDLEPRARRAACPVRPRELASVACSLEDPIAHRGRDVPRLRQRARRALGRGGRLVLGLLRTTFNGGRGSVYHLVRTRSAGGVPRSERGVTLSRPRLSPHKPSLRVLGFERQVTAARTSLCSSQDSSIPNTSAALNFALKAELEGKRKLNIRVRGD